MKKVWKRVVATALTVSLISSFNINKITFAEEKSTNEIAIDANNFPDTNFRNYIKSSFDIDNNDKLSKEEISKATFIFVNMKGINNLTGIEYFTNLECLYAEMNYINSVDLSKNKNLVVAYFNNNLITSITLPNETSNNKLEVLSLFDNRLTEINLSNLDVLRYINLGDNKLTSLDLNVGKIESFTASYNELTEIKLPNSGVTYGWKDLLAEQLYHERTGYDYKWYYDSNRTQEVDPNKTPSIKLEGQTLYSEYTPINYTVEFKSGENNSESKVQNFVYDEAQNLLANEFSKEEYDFSGWKDSKGKIYSDGAEVKNLTSKKGENIVLTAIWTEKDYSDQTYKINLYNGESIVETTEINYGKGFTPSAEKLTKEGYTFLGWSIGNDKEVKYSNGESIIMTSPSQLNGEEVDGIKSLNLYAVWEKVKAESTVNITTDSLDKAYDGKAVANPDVNNEGSTNSVKLTWYKKINSKWEELSAAPVNAGIYKIVASVEADENYKEASSEKEFKISKVENSWTVEPSIEGWKVGENVKSPIGKAKFGEVEFTYSNSENGTFTKEVPKEAGTWYMKAVVIGNENYYDLEVEPIEFVIEKSEDQTEGDQTGDGETSDDEKEEIEDVEDKVVVDDIIISNGNSETNKFTYGDKIVIKFTINDKTRTVKKVALFANNVQVSEAQDAIVGKELTFVYDTTNGLVDATGEVALKLAYVDGNVVGKEIYNSVITLDKKSSESGDIKIPEINENVNLDNLEIKDGDIILKQGVDYDITKTQNGDTVNVVITFKGNYSGSITKTYKVEIKEEEPTKPLPGVKPQVEIRGGERRYETAVELSKSKFNNADTVVIAGGYALADGLTATPIATEYNAPLLLVEKNNIPEATKNEIKRLGAKNIIIVGGTTVITKEVENQLLNLGVTKIIRLGGSDRYETSLLVAKYIDSNLYNIENIVVTNGLGEADAMSISPVSGRDRMPIILVRSTYIPSSVESWLKEKSLNNAYIIGGTTAINDNVLNQINTMTSSDISGNRLGGSTRYETNALIINKFYESTTNKVYVSKGLQLIDALSSGPIAALENSPVVLAGNNLTATQISILSKRSTSTIVQAGHGISSNVIESLKDLLATK